MHMRLCLRLRTCHHRLRGAPPASVVCTPATRPPPLRSTSAGVRCVKEEPSSRAFPSTADSALCTPGVDSPASSSTEKSPLALGPGGRLLPSPSPSRDRIGLARCRKPEIHESKDDIMNRFTIFSLATQVRIARIRIKIRSYFDACQVWTKKTYHLLTLWDGWWLLTLEFIAETSNRGYPMILNLALGSIKLKIKIETFRLIDNPWRLSISHATRRPQRQELESQLGNQLCINQMKVIHARIVKNHINPSHNSFLLTRLAHKHLTCDNLDYARRIFCQMDEPPIFLWNEIIKHHSRLQLHQESMSYFRKMLDSGILPNEFTFTFVLPACAALKSIYGGRMIHTHAFCRKFDSNVFVSTALIDMYGKAGDLSSARQVFDEMTVQVLATYNAMIGSYGVNGELEKTMEIFDLMLEREVELDAVTMVNLLHSCASAGSLQRGRWIHQHGIMAKVQINVHVGAVLIQMYLHCGSMIDAQQVFEEMSERDLICWTTMISGFAMYGLPEMAESMFLRMIREGLNPDGITFLGLLTGFSHGGLVEKGHRYFQLMSERYGLSPGVEHYSCVVDMFGRAGKLEEAEELIKRMTVTPDAVVWGGLLNACRIHKNVELAERVVEEVVRLEPNNAGWYVLMSNVYASAKMWDGVARMRTMMKVKGITKVPGWSSIEVDKRVHRFTVFDRSHPQSAAIYGVLRELEEKMRKIGYAPEMSCVLGNFEEDGLKEELLCGHSERLAIAFGILSTPEGDTLRIIKNLRVCVDCHTATKFITRIVRREIIVRDAKRFHHFKEGKCSCGDYW